MFFSCRLSSDSGTRIAPSNRSCARGMGPLFKVSLQGNRACSAALFFQQTTESVESGHFHLRSLLDSRRSSAMRSVADRLSLQNVGVRVFLSGLILFALVIPAIAQSTASLNGLVTDATG